MRDQVTILSPCGMLRYGFPIDGIVVDAGPHKLGAVVEKLSRAQIKVQYGYVNSLQTAWYKEALGEGATFGK
ncbi:hypothetical protein [Kurthia massiliensis]|uniref:hypothetical protein n=1 Tax=Kurthia massiliensis TaxID=1033739 RepID=UPI0002894FB3|nr:hypothetical protein [Kurthia massiliensis]